MALLVFANTKPRGIPKGGKSDTFFWYYPLTGQVDRSVHFRGRLRLKSKRPPLRHPLTPLSASQMPHLSGYPERRVRRSGVCPRCREMSPAVPPKFGFRRCRAMSGGTVAPAPYIMYGKWALEVLAHEVPKIGESIKQLIKTGSFGP